VYVIGDAYRHILDEAATAPDRAGQSLSAHLAVAAPVIE
jgi:hypothetical protein